MSAFIFISFLFISIVFGLPLFWQIKQPVRDAALMFVWKALNLLLMIGLLFTFISLSNASFLILALLIFSVGAKKKVTRMQTENLKVNRV
ncbi:MAG: hypothetical protein BMS9Abin02_1778 [Anaerolineae bacterium]|nr:MAG: hypothetical protein BMS9Abin02_1778 [Anaerolineae bacterium]